MKYADVVKLPLNTTIVLHVTSTPVEDVRLLDRRSATYGQLVDRENYIERSWTGANGDAWAFDPNHRGMPPVNTDSSSRAKRHLVAIVDPATGDKTGQYLLVMPKNILGLYSAVQTEWEAEAREAEALQAEYNRIAELEQTARAQANTLASNAEASVRKNLSDVMGRPVNYDDVYISLKGETVLNADKTACRPKVGGEVRMSYDLYLRFMEFVYEGLDAQ